MKQMKRDVTTTVTVVGRRAELWVMDHADSCSRTMVIGQGALIKLKGHGHRSCIMVNGYGPVNG